MARKNGPQPALAAASFSNRSLFFEIANESAVMNFTQEAWVKPRNTELPVALSSAFSMGC